jgi:hypothetical protein
MMRLSATLTRRSACEASAAGPLDTEPCKSLPVVALVGACSSNRNIYLSSAESENLLSAALKISTEGLRRLGAFGAEKAR